MLIATWTFEGTGVLPLFHSHHNVPCDQGRLGEVVGLQQSDLLLADGNHGIRAGMHAEPPKVTPCLVARTS